MNTSGGSSMVELPLFQVDDGGSSPTSPLHFYIRKISANAARQWVERWHYSQRMPGGKNICFGLYANGEPYAVIVYGIGVNPYQAQFLGVDDVVEIKRMCRSEPKLDGFPLSRLIAITSKMLRSEFKYDCIVAFADPEHGHEGTVYKAAGFSYEGTTNAEWHLEDRDGTRRHRRYAFRHAKRNGLPLVESRRLLSVTRVKTEPKHRWVLRRKK